MRPAPGTSPNAITLPREPKARAVRTGVTLPDTFSAYLTEMTKIDLDGAGEPGSDEGPVQNTTQPERKGVQNGARGSQ